METECLIEARLVQSFATALRNLDAAGIRPTLNVQPYEGQMSWFQIQAVQPTGRMQPLGQSLVAIEIGEHYHVLGSHSLKGATPE